LKQRAAADVAMAEDKHTPHAAAFQLLSRRPRPQRMQGSIANFAQRLSNEAAQAHDSLFTISRFTTFTARS
jgi:hypothetical protein